MTDEAFRVMVERTLMSYVGREDNDELRHEMKIHFVGILAVHPEKYDLLLNIISNPPQTVL